MATHLDAVLAAEVGNLVGALEVPYAFLRVNLTGFPVVFGCYTVKVLDDERLLGVFSYVALVQRHTNGKIVLVGILQADILSWVDLTPLSLG